MIKAIIFDCFGVLTTDVWKEYVTKLPESLKYQIHLLNEERGSGKMSREQFERELIKLTGKPEEEIKRVSTPGGVKNSVLLEYIGQLKKQGYKIGLLSNIGSDWIREYLLQPSEQKLFDDMVFSFEVGMTKPNPKIFNLACERLGVEPSETVIVDDIDTYCDAAQQVGLRAIVYREFEQCRRELDQILSR